MTTAWRTYSWIGARRPKPPPSIIRCTVTFSFGTPAATAAVASAVIGSWVGAQISTPSGVTCAVQVCGSMVACARNGTA